MNNDEKFIQFILEHGKHYVPADLPKGIRRGRMGQCFDNATLNALANRKKWRYVEGIAESPRFRGLWVLHAWLTDGDRAFDPTWTDASRGYIGVEIPVEDLARFMIRTEYQGVLPNAWREPSLAKACVPGLPVEHISSCFFIDEEIMKV